MTEIEKEKKSSFSIFYSWQSDIEGKYNRYFIHDCLKRAIKELHKDATLNVVTRLDMDTKGSAGSPSIADTILNKINACQIIVADVTNVNDGWLNKLLTARPIPNPNVMIELGYALYRLSWERVICINNSYFSRVEDLPFNFRQNRISVYKYGRFASKEKAREQLTNLFKKAIKEIVLNYDLIEDKLKSSNATEHDRKIFNRLDDLIGDDKFINLLQTIANNQMVWQEDYQFFDQIETFLHADRNKFLMTDLATAASNFEHSISTMVSKFGVNFHSHYQTVTHEAGDEQALISYTFHDMMREEIKEQKMEENFDAIQIVVSEYKAFRKLVKQHLFI